LAVGDHIWTGSLHRLPLFVKSEKVYNRVLNGIKRD